MEKENRLTEEESLQLITEMIRNAKSSFHESGTGAILWGSVVGVCGIISFAQAFWNFYIGFDVWILTLIAFIPQIYISIKEGKNKPKAKNFDEAAMNAIWLCFGITMFMLVFYFNAVPLVSDKFMSQEGYLITILNSKTGTSEAFHSFIPSAPSLLILVYAFPTFITGMMHRFRPMLYGAIICYIMFLVSCFTNSTYDLLMNGIAGIVNWLIPGLILWHRYKAKKVANV